MSTHSEYIPSQNGNGHTNGNGNGHKAPFRLAPTIDPAEEARDNVIRKIAPEIRRQVRRDTQLSAGAKYFFNCLLDDCFWHKAGGHGSGRIYANLKTLAERYCHDKDSIARWRDELIERSWLWCQDEWPMTEFRLTPLMPAPESSTPHQRAVQMSLGQAAHDKGEQNGNMPLDPEKTAKPQNTARPAAKQGRAKPQDAARLSASYGHQSGKMPLDSPHPAVTSGGRMPPVSREDAASVTAGTGHSDTQDAAQVTASDGQRHEKGSSPRAQNERRENTPGDRRSGVSGEGGGEAPAPKGVDPEKLFWNGRHWWPSQLHKNLALLDKSIAGAEGVQRRELVALRNSLLSAMGIPTPTARTQSPQPQQPVKLPPKAEWNKLIAGMREAVSA